MKLVAPDDRYLVVIGRPVEKGEEVDVPDADGESLLAQGWERPKAAHAPKSEKVEEA